MSQQRYSDDPSAASTTATQHRTGRSNYGGGARTNRRGAANRNHHHNHPHGRGNPIEHIGNWIQERRRRHRDRNHGPNGNAAHADGRHDDHSSNHHPVGTEARALQNIRRNAKLFEYPADGFETPIEHSLLYAMIEFPMNYPESVVRKEIDEEDFEVYLYVNEKERRDGGTAADDGGGGDAANASDAYIQSAKNTERRRASYAQLSALLALSAEKNPSKSQAERNTTSSGDNSNKNNNDIPTSSTNSLRLSEGTSHSTIHRSQDNTVNNNNNHTPPTIGQTLCKKLLKTITTYSTRHSLDRASEIREFLTPVEKQCHLKNEKAALQQLLPAYLGYTLSLVTGNPLPLLVGAASLMGKDPMQEENANVNGFRGMGGRVADVERAGLLDECEWEEEG